jgi:integrase/recombinase XerD
VEHPSVYIHYEKARQNWKSRRLALSPGFPKTLETYLRRYQPKALLFECTPRNLEYVLRAASLLAGLPVTLSFETLRWTSALRCYKAGMEPDRLRRRLGLSLIAWRETAPVLERLAQKPL